jgi:hypothetical protein
MTPGPTARPRPPATRDQADAHRYGLRRLEAALVRGDPVPLHEQLRSQRRATVVGAVLAVLGLVAVAVFATFSPRPDWTRESIVVGSPSGAVFAVLHSPDRLVPVTDAIAARLVLAAAGEQPGDPRLVPDEALLAAARTPPSPVTGAVGVQLTELTGGWGVCDGPDGVVVLAGSVDAAALTGGSVDGTGSGTDSDTGSGVARSGAGARPGAASGSGAGAGSGAGVGIGAGSGGGAPSDVGGGAVGVGGVAAVWARSPGGDTFAVVDGVRHAVGDASVLAGLGLSGREPVTVAAAVLSALPEGPAFALPEVSGGPGPTGVPGRPGDLLRTTGVDGVARLFAVVPGGVQEVPASLAEVLRARGGQGPVEVAPVVVAEAPVREELPVAGWPASVPAWAEPSGPVCATWTGTWQLTAGALPVVSGAARVDAVLLRGGGAVRASSPTGGGTVWLVSAAGVAYGVADAATATALGLPTALPEAPESLLRLLPRGPTVDLAQAR